MGRKHFSVFIILIVNTFSINARLISCKHSGKANNCSKAPVLEATLRITSWIFSLLRLPRLFAAPAGLPVNPPARLAFYFCPGMD